MGEGQRSRLVWIAETDLLRIDVRESARCRTTKIARVENRSKEASAGYSVGRVVAAAVGLHGNHFGYKATGYRFTILPQHKTTQRPDDFCCLKGQGRIRR